MQSSQDFLDMGAGSLAAERALAGVLQSDERLLWSGMPPQGLLLRPSDAAAIPFSLLWTGMIIYAAASVLSSSPPRLIHLTFIPFLLVGLHYMVGRFFADRRLRSRMYYGVTSRRALICAGLWRREVRSASLLGLTQVSMRERPDGSGTITFGPPNSPVAALWGSPSWVTYDSERGPSPVFEVAGDLRRIYDIVEGARSALAK